MKCSVWYISPMELDLLKQKFNALHGVGHYEGKNDLDEDIFSDKKGVWYVYDPELDEFIELTDF